MKTDALSPATFFPLADDRKNDLDRSEQQRGVLPLPSKPREDEPSIFAERVWSGVSTSTAQQPAAPATSPSSR